MGYIGVRVWFFSHKHGIDFGHFGLNIQIGYGFCQSGLELGMHCLEENTFSSLSIRPSTKALHTLYLWKLRQVINRVFLFR